MAGSASAEGSGAGAARCRSIADVNVTSLVDVMLVLLIIFMITAPMMQGGVDVELPAGGGAAAHAQGGDGGTVNRDGRIFVDQTPVSLQGFSGRRSVPSWRTRKPRACTSRRTPVSPMAGRAGAGGHPDGGHAERRAWSPQEEETRESRAAAGQEPPGIAAGLVGTVAGPCGARPRFAASVRCSRQGGAAGVRGRAGGGARRRHRRARAPEAVPDAAAGGEAGAGQAAAQAPSRRQGTGAAGAQAAAATEPERGAAAQDRRPRSSRSPGETPSTGTDVATIKTPGLEFPYPEYLRNIVDQVYRRWDRGRRSAEQLRGDQLPDPARRHGARDPVRHPLGQLRFRPRARRARSRRPETPRRSARFPTAGTPTCCRELLLQARTQ